MLVDTLRKELRLLHRQLPNLSIAVMSVVEQSTTGVVTQVMNLTHIRLIPADQFYKGFQSILGQDPFGGLGCAHCGLTHCRICDEDDDSPYISCSLIPDP